jgi:hypothetical protein
MRPLAIVGGSSGQNPVSSTASLAREGGGEMEGLTEARFACSDGVGRHLAAVVAGAGEWRQWAQLFRCRDGLGWATHDSGGCGGSSRWRGCASNARFPLVAQNRQLTVEVAMAARRRARHRLSGVHAQGQGYGTFYWCEWMVEGGPASSWRHKRQRRRGCWQYIFVLKFKWICKQTNPPS